MLNEIDLNKFLDTVEMFKKKKYSVLTLPVDLTAFNSRTKLECVCEHGHTFSKSRNMFMNNSGCPFCANEFGRGKKQLIPYSTIKKNIELSGDYTLVSPNYINGKTKLMIQHTSCTGIFPMRYNDFQQGYRCPLCRSSLSATLKDSLELIKYPYDQEFKIPEIRNQRVLSFDLKVDDVIFEYDGLQHFISRNSTWDTTGAIKRDWIKNTEIRNTDYTLIRICYKTKTSKKLANIINHIMAIKSNKDELFQYIISNNLLLINKTTELNIQNYYLKNNINYFNTYYDEIKNFDGCLKMSLYTGSSLEPSDTKHE